MLFQRRFIESFDAVRFSNEVGVDGRIARTHAEVELLVGLLFGQSVHISEPIAIDSRGFLGIAPQVLSNRQATPDPSFRRAPFYLCTVSEPKSLKQVLVQRLRKEGFILSGWPGISNDMSLRAQIAHLVAADQFPRAVRECTVRGLDAEAENLEWLAKLCDAFPTHSSVVAGSVPAPLLAYSQVLASELTAVSQDEELSVPAARIKYAIKRLQKHGVDLDNRSEMRRYRDLIVGDFGEQTYDDLIDFADTAYNMVVGDSLVATELFFSVRKPTTVGAESLGERLAHRVRARLLPVTHEEVFPGSLRLEINVDGRLYPQIHDIIPPIDWNRIMSLINHPIWRESLSRLESSLKRGDIDAAQTFVDQHLALVNKEIAPYVVDRHEGFLRVLLRNPKIKTREMKVSGGKAIAEVLFQAVFGIQALAKLAGVAVGAALGAAVPTDSAPTSLITGTITHLRSEGEHQ